MNMSYEMLGIVATFVILGSCLALAGVNGMDIDFGNAERIIPQITSSTNTSTPNVYFEWCYKMNLDCS